VGLTVKLPWVIPVNDERLGPESPEKLMATGELKLCEGVKPITEKIKDGSTRNRLFLKTFPIKPLVLLRADNEIPPDRFLNLLSSKH
jgi:hypothetical protein